MPLTKEQDGIYKKILGWLTDPSSHEAVLDAMAGTGKSYLISYIKKHIVKDHEKLCDLLGVPLNITDVQVSATTNKAVSSLHAVNCSHADTVCRTLGAILTYNDTGKKILKLRSKTKIRNILLIVDECSMVDWDLYQLIAEKLDKSCKILYCGDKNQLAPVKCIGGVSPIYLNKNIERFSLTKLIRSKKHTELQDIAYQLHDNVDTKTWKPINTFKGVIDQFVDQKDQIKELEKFINPNYDARVITYTNEKSGLYTDYIRKLRGYTEALEIGEVYITNSYYINSKTKVSIPTDSIVKILDKDKEQFLNVKDFSIAVIPTTILVNGSETVKVLVASDRVELNRTLKELSKLSKLYSAQVATQILVLDYAHASTIHKAQGTTCNTIYIDCADISKCRNPDTVARLLYVATTRATDRIVFLNDLNTKYGEITHDTKR